MQIQPSPTELVLDPFELRDPSESEELEALQKALKFAEGFKLIFVECDPLEQRLQLMSNVSRALPNHNIRRVFLKEPILHLLDELRQDTQDRSPSAIFVTGLEYSLPHFRGNALSPFIANLNASRNSFPQSLPYPLVLWVPARIIKAILLGAPDFFSVRSGAYYFAPRQFERPKFGEVGASRSDAIASQLLAYRDACNSGIATFISTDLWDGLMEWARQDLGSSLSRVTFHGDDSLQDFLGLAVTSSFELVLTDPEIDKNVRQWFRHVVRATYARFTDFEQKELVFSDIAGKEGNDFNVDNIEDKNPYYSSEDWHQSTGLVPEIDTLPDQERQIVSLYVDGRSVLDVSKVTGLSSIDVINSLKDIARTLRERIHKIESIKEQISLHKFCEGIDVYSDSAMKEVVDGYVNLRRALRFFNASDWENSQEYFALSISYFEENKDYVGLLRALMGSANTYVKQSKLTSARNSYETALSIGKLLDHKDSIASIYNSLGFIALRLRQFKEAENAVRLSLETAAKTQDSKVLVTSLTLLSDIYYRQAKFQESEQFLRQALKESEVSMDDNAPVILNRLGRILIAQKRYEEAEAVLKQSVDYSEVLGRQSNALKLLSNLYRSLGRDDEANILIEHDE